MHPIVAPDAELATRIAQTGQPHLLSDLFRSRTRRWRYHVIHEECVTLGLFYDLEQQVQPDVAFALVAEAVGITLSQDDPDLFTTALSLLAGLAQMSKTTEMPEGLRQNWTDLERRAADFAPTADSTWRYLKSWYRR